MPSEAKSEVALGLEYVSSIRSALFANGYRVVPVLTGEKRPIQSGWPQRARMMRAEDAGDVDPRCQNTGILCDGLRAVDIDCDDPAMAVQVRSLALKMLGPAPMRIRSNSPRCTLVYRAASGSPKKRTESQLEVLGHGQQFVAFGTHPTGVNFEWLQGSLLSVARKKLTAVSEKQLNDFIEAYYAFNGIEPPPAKAKWCNVSLHEGIRNDALTSLAGRWRWEGRTGTQIERGLQSRNARQSPKPLPLSEVQTISKSISKRPPGGRNALKEAWDAIGGDEYHSGYVMLHDLAYKLQSVRPGNYILLPLKEIGKLRGCDWTQIRRWRNKLRDEGYLEKVENYVPHLQADKFIFVECPTKRCPTKGVPLLKATTGLVGHLEGADDKGTVWL